MEQGAWLLVIHHAIPHNREKMSVGCPEPEPLHSLPCCGPGAAPVPGAGVPLLTEDMQALTLRTLTASDVTKHYELVRELGKGTYGKVDLVAYKGTGECWLVMWQGIKVGVGTCLDRGPARLQSR